MITLIVARDRNGAIGKENTIPWRAPEDLNAFKRETLGGAVIMGRNTWESLPFKPLKDRLNIVVSSQSDLCETVFPTIEEAIDYAYAQGYRRLYGIGGFGIYRSLLAHADRMLITEVDVEVEAPDTFFPDFETAEWIEAGAYQLRRQAPACRMVEYLRKTG